MYVSYWGINLMSEFVVCEDCVQHFLGSHMAGIYSDCSTREVNNKSASFTVLCTDTYSS